MTLPSVFSSLTHFTYFVDDQRVGWLSLDYLHEAVNRLSPQVLTELAQAIEALAASPPKGLVLLSGKPTGFIAGADINAFANLRDTQRIDALIDQGCRVFDDLQALPFPTVALVQGHCLGGGLELALACKKILVIDDPKTALALPEVRIGIFPGWGGAMRLPKRIGTIKALDLMLTGRSLNARQAVKLGLADSIAAPRLARQAARSLALSTRVEHQQTRAWRFERVLDHRCLRPVVHFLFQKKISQQDPAQHYPAPRLILQLWKNYNGDPRLARGAIHALIQHPTTHNLLRVYQLQERLKGMARQKETSEPIRHVHVVGAGVMGGEIAAWAALKGFEVTLSDQNTERLGQAIGRAHSLFKQRLREPRLAQAARDRLVPDIHGYGVRAADLVIEAIVEDAEAKMQLYDQLEASMRVDALLATNTSSLTLQDLSHRLRYPQRFLGLHFFNPVSRMPLVEVISGPLTNSVSTQNAMRFVQQLDKLPLPVASTPGFLVNAVLAPYILQAMQAVDRGIPPETIDAAMVSFGMPMGPIQLADTVGLDIIQAAGQRLSAQTSLPQCLQQKLSDGLLGRKTGRGFYLWQEGKIRKSKRTHTTASHELKHELLGALLEQAQRCLDHKVVTDADLVDAGMIFGAGFAPHTGGPLNYKKTIAAATSHAGTPA